MLAVNRCGARGQATCYQRLLITARNPLRQGAGCRLPLAHLDGRKPDPGHAVCGAAVVLRVEQQNAAQNEKCRRM